MDPWCNILLSAQKGQYFKYKRHEAQYANLRLTPDIYETQRKSFLSCAHYTKYIVLVKHSNVKDICSF